MTFRFDPNLPGDSAGWTAWKSWLDNYRAKFPTPGTPTPASTPAAPAAWKPSYFNQPQTPYPANPFVSGDTTGGRGGGGGSGRMMGGGGGGGVRMNLPAISVPPEMSLGPGSYWPGHSAERAAQQQAAILGIMQGRLQPDTRDPAQMAAAMAYDASRGISGGRKQVSFGGGGGRGGLAGGYQDAYNMAEQANEARYADIMSGYQARRDANLGAGAQEAKDINTGWDAEIARRRQEMIGRGMGNSNVLQNAVQGGERERLDSQGRLQERLRAEEARLLADQLQFMERRTDQGPDMNQAIALAQGLGNAGVGQPQVIGTQVVPTMGGVGFVPGGGYSMPVSPVGGFARGTAVGGGPSAQMIRAAHVRANQGDIRAQAWLRLLNRNLSATA